MSEKEARGKYRVAMSSVIAAVFLTGAKLTVGLATNSLGILSEAAHSALDLFAAMLTYFAVRISDIPADEGHQYGHGKVEGLSAFIEVVLLLATCIYIINEAIERITGKAAPVEVNVYAFAVMIVSIVIDVSRSLALYRAARRHRSQALEADALHFASDIFSSLVVIAGLIGYRYLGFPLADAIAALAVSALVIIVSMRLALRTINVLLDRAPSGAHRRIKRAVEGIDGVRGVESLRARSSGATTFVDMRLALDSGLSFVDAHEISDRVEGAVQEIIPGADVMVHADPESGAGRLVEIRERLAMLLREHRSMFRRYHDLHVIHHGNAYIVSLHLVMTGSSTLDEAHRVCDHLERDIKQKLPGARVSIHVEPPKGT